MVRQLSVALDSAELRYEQLRGMIGADIVRDPLAISATLPLAPGAAGAGRRRAAASWSGPDGAARVATR